MLSYLLLQIKFMSTSWEIVVFRSMQQKSLMLKSMWLGAARQNAITWENIDPHLCPHMASLGHNELILNPSCTELFRGNIEIYLYFASHDDVIKWKHFPRYWPFVQGIHRSPVNSPHKGQWRRAFMFSLICVWINGWVNNREAGDLRRYRVHHGITVMISWQRLQREFKSFHPYDRQWPINLL